MNRRRFLLGSLAGAGIAATAACARFIERHAVEVESVALDLGLPRSLRVAVLGDIHFDPLYEIDYLREVMERTRRQGADLVVFTGDFISRSTTRLDELALLLGESPAAASSFAVLGNHDHDVNADAVSAALESAGIVVLRNRSVPLPGQRGWRLTGLESFWCGRPNLDVIADEPASRHLLLVHEPDSFDLVAHPGVALQVSGHTHGGQVRVPVFGAVALPTWGKKYQAGLYARGERSLYVNRGIGTVDHHFRLNCRPEITLLNLT